MDLFRQYVRKSSSGPPPPPQPNSATAAGAGAEPISAATTPSILRKMSGEDSSSSMAPITVLGGGGILLRVSGLGQQFDFDVSPSNTTLGQLKREIEKRTSIPAPYQRLVAKRKIMDDDSMILGSPAVLDGSGNTITPTAPTKGFGLENRTKILLFHSPLYEQDREGIDKLITLSKEIDRIETDRQNHVIDNKTVQELIIQVCCKLDCVETHGSDSLRKVRKSTIVKAEAVAHASEMRDR
jgi:hypothetical protein